MPLDHFLTFNEYEEGGLGELAEALDHEALVDDEILEEHMEEQRRRERERAIERARRRWRERAERYGLTEMENKQHTGFKKHKEKLNV